MAHHRSGSNFLNDLLQAHPCIECINEPLSMHTPFFRGCDLAAWSQSDFHPGWLHASLQPHGALRSFLFDLKEHLAQSHGGRIAGFKETGLFGKLAWFKAFIPDLKVVFLQRNPRAIVSSVLRSGLMPLWFYAELVPPAFREVCPEYRSVAEDADDATRTAEVAAMSVVTRYALARRELPLFDHLVLDLDTMAHQPVESLKAVTDFFGLEPHPDQVSFLLKRQGTSRGGVFSSFRSPADVKHTWRGHLSPSQIEAIEHVLSACGERSNEQGDSKLC
jgi:hypothetical protein